MTSTLHDLGHTITHGLEGAGEVAARAASSLKAGAETAIDVAREKADVAQKLAREKADVAQKAAKERAEAAQKAARSTADIARGAAADRYDKAAVRAGRRKPPRRRGRLFPVLVALGALAALVYVSKKLMSGGAAPTDDVRQPSGYSANGAMPANEPTSAPA